MSHNFVERKLPSSTCLQAALRQTGASNEDGKYVTLSPCLGKNKKKEIQEKDERLKIKRRIKEYNSYAEEGKIKE